MPASPRRPRCRSALVPVQASLSKAARAKTALPTRPFLKLLAVGVSISGCNLDSNFSDLGEKLLNPDVQGFDTPGQRWLSGSYFDLSIQNDAAGARYALARNEADELSIVDLAAKTQCHTDSVTRYGNPIPSPGQPTLIPLLRQDSHGVSQLGFSTFGCDLLPFQVPSGALPLDVLEGVPTGTGTGLLIRTPEQGLALIDPWSGSSQLVARSVRGSDPASAFGHYLWVDEGSIVISDRALTPVAHFGEQVSEIGVSPQDAELAYIEPSPDATVGGTLFVVNALGKQEPRALASDACGLRYLALGSSRKLSYFSPCADRRLLLRDTADDSTLVIADGVAGPPSVYRIGGDWQLAYITTASPDTSTGTLWMREAAAGAEPKLVAEHARANLSTVTPDGGGLLTMLDWSNSGGRLVEWRDEGLKDVANNVIEFAPLGLLANQDLTLLGNFDGTTGDLLRLNRDLTTEVLASGVPTHSASEEAFLANFDGTQGELRLFHREDGSSDLLGTGVSRGSFKLAVQFKGVMMLSGRDPKTNTSSFQVRLLDSGETYLLNTGVTEAREVAFPSRGLMYNVISGDQAGVWFSKTL